MNLAKYSLDNTKIIYFFLAVLLIGGITSFGKLGKKEDAPFVIKPAVIMTRYPGAEPAEVERLITEPISREIQSMSGVYKIKSESMYGLSKITFELQPSLAANSIPQKWDELRRKVLNIQPQLPNGASTPTVSDDFGDVLGVFYGLTGESYTYRELEDQAKLIKNEILKVKDVAKVEIYGVQTPTIDVKISPSGMALSGITTADIARAFEGQNKVVDAGGIDVGENRVRIESTGNFYSLDDIRNLTIVSRTGEHFRLADIAEIKESYQTPPSNKMRIDGKPAIGIAISTVPTGNVVDMADAVKVEIK